MPISRYLFLSFEFEELNSKNEIVLNKQISVVRKNESGINDLISTSMAEYFLKHPRSRSNSVSDFLDAMKQWQSNQPHNLNSKYNYKKIKIHDNEVQTEIPQLTLSLETKFKNVINLRVFYFDVEMEDTNLYCYSLLTHGDRTLARYRQEIKIDDIDNFPDCRKKFKKAHMNSFKKIGIHNDKSKFLSSFGVFNRNCLWFSNDVDECKLHTIGFYLKR